jgi:hypothetical protein
MMKSVLAAILALGAALCWARAAGGPPVYPDGFVEAAGAFRNAAITNRSREAAVLSNKLPTTPVTSKSFTGTASSLAGRGSRFITRDYNKPSFLLSRSEALRFLGRPSETNSFLYVYPVESGSTNKFNVYLVVEFHEDYAVGSMVCSTTGSWSGDDANQKSPRRETNASQQR